jgi:predicted RNA binding protein YcfA (HicA-like mRNA interferase family)
MKVKHIRKLIEADGWMYSHSKGSHHQYKHPTKSGKVTIPGKDSDDLHPKTAKSILIQAGLN